MLPVNIPPGMDHAPAGLTAALDNVLYICICKMLYYLKVVLR